MFSLTNRHRVLPYLLAAAWGWACTDTPGASPANESVHADSAGIEIVVNAVGADGASAFATLDATPSLRLGAPEGRPEEQFGRVSDVVPMPDGGVAVLDAQAAEIRMFDADGAYRSTLGGRGQGPGEFQRPIALAWLARDTLAVFDAGPNRITRFGAGGEPVRTTTLEGTGPRITAAAFLHDGRLIGQSHWLNPDGGALPGPDLTFVRDTVVLTLFAAAGTVEDTVDVLPEIGRAHV